MDNDEFEIPDYDQLEKTNNNNNNSLNLNNSYKLPTNKKETVKQRYEEHVQATLDYRADVVESNQRSPSMPENESKQQQKPEDINVNYEELYRNAITSSDNININIDSNNSDNNNNNNNNMDELERVAMAYNAQRSKQIEQEVANNNEDGDYDDHDDDDDDEEEEEQLDPSIRWVTLEATEETDPIVTNKTNNNNKRNNTKKKGKKKRSRRRKVPNNIKVTTYRYSRQNKSAEYKQQIESDVQAILETLQSTEPVRRTAVDLKEGQAIRYSLPSKEAKAQAIEALKLRHEEEELVRERERKKQESLERQKREEIEERKRFKAFIEIQEEKNALKSSEMLRAKELIVIRRLERLEKARKKKQLERRRLEKEKREAVRIRRIEQTKEAAKKIKAQLDERWENAVALKESGKLQSGYNSIPSAWDRERNNYKSLNRMNSYMHRGGGGFSKRLSPGRVGSNKTRSPARRRGGGNSNNSFRENVRGEPSETRWARAKREAEARKKKEDEDLLKEELDRQKRLVEQLRKKNREKAKLQNRLATRESNSNSNHTNKNEMKNNNGSAVKKKLAAEKAAKEEKIKLSRERKDKIKLARKRRKVLEAKLNRETRERIALQRKLEEKEAKERARIELMAKRKAAKEKEQAQQESPIESKTDTNNNFNNNKKKSSKNIIRKPITVGGEKKKKAKPATKAKSSTAKNLKVGTTVTDNGVVKSTIIPPQKSAKRWDRVQKEAAERRRVVEELKKSEDQRKELKQKLLDEANKRKKLQAEIEAREVREKKFLEDKREKNRMLIKMKEEKLRKLKLYEAEQVRIHMEEEKKWGKNVADNRSKKLKKGAKNRSVVASRSAGSKEGMSPKRRGKNSGLRFVKNKNSPAKSMLNKKFYTKSSGKRLEQFIDNEISQRLKEERDLWEKEKQSLLQKINSISNKQDNSVELDESSAEYKLMSEKNRQLEIIENELQKVTTALNASQINESQRALSPETSIDSEYEALGGWKEMQDLLSAYIPEQQQQQQQQQQKLQQKKNNISGGKSFARKKNKTSPNNINNNKKKQAKARSKSGMRIVAKTPTTPTTNLTLPVNSVVADNGNKNVLIQSTYAPTPEMFGGMSPVRKQRIGNEHVNDVRNAIDQVGDIEFVEDNENPRENANNVSSTSIDVKVTKTSQERPSEIDIRNRNLSAYYLEEPANKDVEDANRHVNNPGITRPIPSSSIPHGWKVVDNEYVKEDDDSTVVPSLASWARNDNKDITNTPVNKPEKIEIGGTTETPSSLFKTDIVDTVVNDHQNKNRLKPVSLKMSPNAEEEVESDTQKKADEISSDGMSSPIEEMMI